MIKFETTENVNIYELDLPSGDKAGVKVVTTITTPSKVAMRELREYIKKHAVPVDPDNSDDGLEFDGDAIGLGYFSGNSLDHMVDEVVDYLINELNVQVN